MYEGVIVFGDTKFWKLRNGFKILQRAAPTEREADTYTGRHTLADMK
jgi:hypothetical protein